MGHLASLGQRSACSGLLIQCNRSGGEAVLLKDESGDRPHRVVWERSRIGRRHFRMLETDEIAQRLVGPPLQKRVAEQGGSLGARQIGPVTLRAVVVEVLLPLPSL